MNSSRVVESPLIQLSLVRMVFAECFTRGCLHNSTANETVINEYSRLRRFATSSGSGSE
jgi:hypothetical protein